MTKITKELEELTPKQRKFVLEYMKTGNGSQAARQAGYKGNADTIKSIASENLTKPYVEAAIGAMEKPILEKYQITVERTMGEIAKIGYADWSQLQLNDKLKALKLLGDHLGTWKDPTVHINLQNVSDAELDQKISNALTALGQEGASGTLGRESTKEEGEPD